MPLPAHDFRNEPLPDSIDPADLPEIGDEQFPIAVVTDNERGRYRLCHALAQRNFPEEPVMIRRMALTLYNNPPVRTGE